MKVSLILHLDNPHHHVRSLIFPLPRCNYGCVYHKVNVRLFLRVMNKAEAKSVVFNFFTNFSNASHLIKSVPITTGRRNILEEIDLFESFASVTDSAMYNLTISCDGCQSIDRARSSAVRNIQPLLRSKKYDSQRTSLLVVWSPSRSTRQRRATKCDYCCGVRHTSIMFSSLGWRDFIISPKSLLLGYCTGACEGKAAAHVGRHSNHGALVKHPKLPSLPTISCCHATRYKPVRLIYVAQSGRIESILLNDLVADECGCS